MLLTAFAKRETFLPEVFLWNTPLAAALLISAEAITKAALAASLSPATTAASTFLIKVLTLLPYFFQF